MALVHASYREIAKAKLVQLVIKLNASYHAMVNARERAANPRSRGQPAPTFRGAVRVSLYFLT